MGRITYEQALADHTYLWETYGPADDMTGAYVDQEDLARLLRSPTKTTARQCLCDQIDHWFNVGPDPDHSKYGRRVDANDPRLIEIAHRYERGIPA